MENEIIKFIAKVIAYGGSGAAIAYAIFVFLGKKWIENKFSERLEAYKHLQNKELEELKYKITLLFNRVTKIHEKEFEILPEAWMKMQDALGHISRLTSVYQQYPDLNQMNEQKLKELLDSSDFKESEKQEITEAPDKVGKYRDLVFWHDLFEVEKAFNDFHNFILRNKIFLDFDLQEHFINIDEIMRDVLVKREISHEAKDNKMWVEAYKQMRDEIEPIKEKIEKLVQKRLHYQDAD